MNYKIHGFYFLGLLGLYLLILYAYSLTGILVGDILFIVLFIGGIIVFLFHYFIDRFLLSKGKNLILKE